MYSRGKLLHKVLRGVLCSYLLIYLFIWIIGKPVDFFVMKGQSDERNTNEKG